MKTYMYTVKNSSLKRGYNREISVYRIKNNQPIYIGTNDEINTASYKGDYAIACELISKYDKTKMSKDGYSLESKDIKIIELGWLDCL